jgi:hypothetical protein
MVRIDRTLLRNPLSFLIWLTFSPFFPQSNLTLYAVTALLILDSDGNRILAKYYNPPHSSESHSAPAGGAHPHGHPHAHPVGPPGLSTLKEQKALEKSIHEKTKRGGGMCPPPVILLPNDLNTHILSLWTLITQAKSTRSHHTSS